MTAPVGAAQLISDEVASWPGVHAGEGERGELAFTLGPRELGHLHGDRVMDTSFPRALWDALFEEGRIGYHPVFPGKPGFAARSMDTDDDVRDVIALLRLNYDRAVTRYGVPDEEPLQST